MPLTNEEAEELAQIINARRLACETSERAAVMELKRIARDPVKRRKQFKIVPGAALSREAARLAQFYESASREQRAAFDTLLSLFGAGVCSISPKTG